MYLSEIEVDTYSVDTTYLIAEDNLLLAVVEDIVAVEEYLKLFCRFVAYFQVYIETWAENLRTVCSQIFALAHKVCVC